MKLRAEALLTELEELTRKHLHEAERLAGLTEATLNAKPDAGGWSALECLEHLNRYGDFYLPEIAKRLDTAKAAPDSVYRSGWLGQYFAESMKPKPKLNRMKTFKSMDPANSTLDGSVISRFIRQQQQLLVLLDRARRVHLGKVKTAISITPLIKLRLGDTLRVVIYHNERHIQQAQRAIGSRPF
ncbi:DinB family protein [Parapedobacter pyrenivorans]|uniref:DinB family protein n=1 Tax=Parapedobacter pyrenivorans TaxID=1305674 RepID=UPI003342A998